MSYLLRPSVYYNIINYKIIPEVKLLIINKKTVKFLYLCMKMVHKMFRHLVVKTLST